ncbi:unnamed protein product, partial [Rangifer tarandus platyrhynchus]
DDYYPSDSDPLSPVTKITLSLREIFSMAYNVIHRSPGLPTVSPGSVVPAWPLGQIRSLSASTSGSAYQPSFTFVLSSWRSSTRSWCSRKRGPMCSEQRSSSLLVTLSTLFVFPLWPRHAPCGISLCSGSREATGRPREGPPPWSTSGRVFPSFPDVLRAIPIGSVRLRVFSAGFSLATPGISWSSHFPSLRQGMRAGQAFSRPGQLRDPRGICIRAPPPGDARLLRVLHGPVGLSSAFRRL